MRSEKQTFREVSETNENPIQIERLIELKRMILKKVVLIHFQKKIKYILIQ